MKCETYIGNILKKPSHGLVHPEYRLLQIQANKSETLVFDANLTTDQTIVV